MKPRPRGPADVAHAPERRTSTEEVVLHRVRLSALVMVAAACLAAGCQSVRVNTVPEDARITADGEDISEAREFKEGAGLGAHQVTVKKKGYETATVEVPRDRMVPWLRWGALVGALGCATCSSFCAANVGMVLCNRNVPLSLLGYTVGSLIGLGGSDPVAAVGNVIVVTALAPDVLMVPGMAILGLLGAWPLLGLLVPVFFPRSAPEVNVVLRPAREGDALEGDAAETAAPKASTSKAAAPK